MRVAIVGCGKISGSHLEALQEIDGLQVCGVCDRNLDNATKAAGLTQGARVYAELEDLLQQEQPDAVHVLTPPATHAALAVQAMEAGCHVLVEKPMALGVDEADKMIAVSQQMGVKLCVNHNAVFKPSVVKARQLVDGGEIGRVIHVESYYGLAGEAEGYADVAGRAHWAWRLPGGVFTNFWPHLISLQLAFLPQADSVVGVALGGTGSIGEMPTEMTVLLQAPGASGTMVLSMRAKPPVKFVDIYGTRGIIHADLVREVCTLHRDRRLPRPLSRVLFSFEDSSQLALGTMASTAKVVTGRMKSAPGLRTLVRQFYAQVQSNGPPPVSGQDGRQVLGVMERIWAAGSEAASRIAVPAKTVESVDQQVELAPTVLGGKPIPGKVLVTGATGFLGYHLVTALSQCGADVVALVRDKSRVPQDLERQVELVGGDLRRPDSIETAMRDVSIVYHCAAVTANNAAWKAHYETNILGTETIFQEALKAGVQHVIHVSSVIVYGLEQPGHDGYVNELTPYASRPDKWAYYMRSKIEADRLARKYRYESGLPVTILRLGILYGPGGRRSVGRGLLQLGSIRLVVGSGGNRLPYLYVGNAVDCLLLAAVSPVSIGQEYNVVDEPQMRLRDVIQQSARIKGEQAKLVPVPPFLLLGAASLMESRDSSTPPKLSRYVVGSACRDLRYDTTKAREQLGWHSRVSLEEALHRTFRDELA